MKSQQKDHLRRNNLLQQENQLIKNYYVLIVFKDAKWVHLNKYETLIGHMKEFIEMQSVLVQCSKWSIT